MTKWTVLAASAVVALALTMPQLARGQATPRGGSDSPSAPSGSESSSDSGRHAPQGSSGSTAAPRSAPSAPSVPLPAVSPRSTAPGADSTRNASRTSDGRTRGDRPAISVAEARRSTGPQNGPLVNRSPSYRSYRYAPGYPSSFGLGTYDLWFYGYPSSAWWYYPYGAGPFGRPYRAYGWPCYGPSSGYGYGFGDGYGGSTNGDWNDGDESPVTGSIRLRVSPRQANVYIDGALVGTADDFDGLTNHLDIEPGTHQLELRAPGYEPFVTNISVVRSKTLTTRANLKKLK